MGLDSPWDYDLHRELIHDATSLLIGGRIARGESWPPGWPWGHRGTRDNRLHEDHAESDTLVLLQSLALMHSDPSPLKIGFDSLGDALEKITPAHIDALRAAHPILDNRLIADLKIAVWEISKPNNPFTRVEGQFAAFAWWVWFKYVSVPPTPSRSPTPVPITSNLFEKYLDVIRKAAHTLDIRYTQLGWKTFRMEVLKPIHQACLSTLKMRLDQLEQEPPDSEELAFIHQIRNEIETLPHPSRGRPKKNDEL